jgi:hypothetical protein
MKKIIFLFAILFSFEGWSQLPYNFVKISNSPTNSKYRAIEIVGYNLRMDLNEMRILTRRHFYSQDPTTNLSSELTSSDYSILEHVLTANNDANHLCNPANGLTVTNVSTDPSTPLYKDAQGTTVASPIGLFDYFKPLLSQNVALLTLLVQNVTAEDQIYHTWDK